jgi:F-box-like
LLQVCKRWHAIAASTPRLWTHIQIKVEPAWDQREAARKNAVMVKSHLEHSASLPLHINLDLSDMLDQELQTDYTDLGECDNDLCCAARNVAYRTDAYQDRMIDICESYGPGQVSEIVHELVGEDGMHMGRWKTVHILLPSNGRDVKEIWELFSGPTPQLTELLISGKRLSQRALVSGSKGPIKFPDLSSLESLTLQGVIQTDIDFLGLSFPSIKHLELEMDTSLSSQLSLFTSLEHLDVLFQGEPAAGDVPAIHLPVLRDLTIHVYGPTGVEWHVPILQTLTIFESPDEGSKELPNVQAMKVRWELGFPSEPAGFERPMQRTLQKIISKYSDAQELSIHAPLKPIWEEYVQDLSEEKRLVLPTVDFYEW